MITERYAMLFGNDVEVKQLTHRILREGCVVLPDFFDQATKDTLTKYSQSLVGKERYAIKLRDGTPAMEVARSPEFMRVFDTIHKARCKIQNTEYKPLDPKRQAISLPLKTADADTPPTPFHFDDSYINAVFAM